MVPPQFIGVANRKPPADAEHTPTVRRHHTAKRRRFSRSGLVWPHCIVLSQKPSSGWRWSFPAPSTTFGHAIEMGQNPSLLSSLHCTRHHPLVRKRTATALQRTPPGSRPLSTQSTLPDSPVWSTRPTSQVPATTPAGWALPRLFTSITQSVTSLDLCRMSQAPARA